MSKINKWIDNSPAVHWFMFFGSLLLAGIAMNGKHYLALAFFIGAGIIFLPPMQKNINAVMEQGIERRYFMNMGIIMLIIAMFAQIKH